METGITWEDGDGRWHVTYTPPAQKYPQVAIVSAVDGGGRILVNAQRELTAAINGGGKIRYWGDPKLTQDVEGGGSVERGD